MSYYSIDVFEGLDFRREGICGTNTIAVLSGPIVTTILLTWTQLDIFASIAHSSSPFSSSSLHILKSSDLRTKMSAMGIPQTGLVPASLFESVDGDSLAGLVSLTLLSLLTLRRIHGQ